MVILSVENLAKSYGPHTIFDGVTFGIEEGDKVGIIGRNGAGKSTLVRMLVGDEPCDDGRIVHANDSRVIFLPQDPDLDDSLTALEVVTDDSSSEVFEVVRDYEHACAALAKTPGDQALTERVAELGEQMDLLDGWTIEADAKAMLTRLGIEDLHQLVGTMSGGQRKRVALAQALLRPSTLLILDEPTNHLDVETVEWLEGYLASRQQALMLITHDRYFLDRVTNVILEISDGTIYRHNGNYSYFIEKRADRIARAQAEHQKNTQLAKKELEWLRRGPKARTSKAKSRIDDAHALLDKVARGPASKTTTAMDDDLDFVGSRLGKKIVEMEHVTKRFGDNTVLEDVTYFVPRRDRLGIVGPNGAGKTTLLNVICGRLEPDEGTVEIGQTVKFGYYDQESEDLDPEVKVFDYIIDISNKIETSDGYLSATQMLERFGFSRQRQHVYIKTLSGGERRRLYLLRTLMAQPNVIMLDEPTNDLDVDTLAVLEDYLDGFDGVLVVVSHDRYFLDRTVDHLLVVGIDGSVTEFPGNYSQYAEKRNADEKAAAEAEKAAAAPPVEETKSQKEKTKLSYKEQREYETLEARIAEIEERLPAIDEEMVAKSSDFEALQALSEERQSLEEELETGLERWMELAEYV